MKEGSNNSDKIACPRSVDTTLNFRTYYQQLPIKVKLLRQQVRLLIEKKATLYQWHSFQSNMPVPVYAGV